MERRGANDYENPMSIDIEHAKLDISLEATELLIAVHTRLSAYGFKKLLREDVSPRKTAILCVKD